MTYAFGSFFNYILFKKPQLFHSVADRVLSYWMSISFLKYWVMFQTSNILIFNKNIFLLRLINACQKSNFAPHFLRQEAYEV